MFTVLLESRARRQRRRGGAALSAAVHLAIIASAVAATARARAPRPPAVEVVRVSYRPPPMAHPSPAHVPATTAAPRLPNAAPVVVNVPVPVITPRSLPGFDLARAVATDSIVIGGRAGAGPGAGPRGTLDLGSDNPSTELRGNDLLVRVVTAGRPRYPEALRQTGVSGRVLVRFAVDTTGRVDMTSVQVLESSHDLFARAVRDALPAFRFRPMEVHGRRVIAVAEMPFEFAITR